LGGPARSSPLAAGAACLGGRGAAGSRARAAGIPKGNGVGRRRQPLRPRGGRRHRPGTAAFAPWCQSGGRTDGCQTPAHFL